MLTAATIFSLCTERISVSVVGTVARIYLA